MVTMLQRVDNGWYITRSTFLQDIDLIVSIAKVYNGEDYNGAQIVSRACQLRDVVHGMISQMDPAIVAYCDKIAAQGGPVHLSNELRGSTFPATPVVQLGTTTRLSARLRNVKPKVSVNQSYEALKHTKKSSDVAHGAFVERSDGYSIPQLERLYSRMMKRVSQTKLDCKTSALSFLLNFVEDDPNF
ncbi:hypothetical protein Ahy_A06g027966 [Arachis hypogaea]|uniref:Bromo domain-containing protein n=1 Tax=Arachis hypogaea TaxID=3818 RepID=A0A445CQ88_ARAHY|nr:hypothetical protein Ahy_A06g027966 [Arachis hypogaea]